jgi:hypothetical protein
MDLNELRLYKNWVGRTPQEIIAVVKGISGGWLTVFPKGLPIWAHRVRNYFNVEPKFLTRFQADTAKEMLATIQAGRDAVARLKAVEVMKKSGLGHLAEIRKLPDPPKNLPEFTLGQFAETVGLSGDVYKDETGKPWFQMSPGGTIYHWGSDPKIAIVEAYKSNYLDGQKAMPIFKLLSPDGTGGSHETIIDNVPVYAVEGTPLKVGREHIGAVNEKVPVEKLVNTNYWHQGSYNYSETVEVGLPAHEKRDISPHKKYPYPDVYVNPPDRFSSLASRRFPEKVSNERNPLANQI